MDASQLISKSPRREQSLKQASNSGHSLLGTELLDGVNQFQEKVYMNTNDYKIVLTNIKKVDGVSKMKKPKQIELKVLKIRVLHQQMGPLTLRGCLSFSIARQ